MALKFPFHKTDRWVLLKFAKVIREKRTLAAFKGLKRTRMYFEKPFLPLLLQNCVKQIFNLFLKGCRHSKWIVTSQSEKEKPGEERWFHNEAFWLIECHRSSDEMAAEIEKVRLGQKLNETRKKFYAFVKKLATDVNIFYFMRNWSFGRLMVCHEEKYWTSGIMN